MIRMLQVLCGPRRHAIFGILYNDQDMPAEEVMVGMEAMVEEEVAQGRLNRRCEICDKPVIQFLYEDGVAQEQDWGKAKAVAERLGAEQMMTRRTVMAARKAQRN